MLFILKILHLGKGACSEKPGDDQTLVGASFVDRSYLLPSVKLSKLYEHCGNAGEIGT